MYRHIGTKSRAMISYISSTLLFSLTITSEKVCAVRQKGMSSYQIYMDSNLGKPRPWPSIYRIRNVGEFAPKRKQMSELSVESQARPIFPAKNLLISFHN